MPHESSLGGVTAYRKVVLSLTQADLSGEATRKHHPVCVVQNGQQRPPIAIRHIFLRTSPQSSQNMSISPPYTRQYQPHELCLLTAPAS